jgi:hypothetical protein
MADFDPDECEAVFAKAFGPKMTDPKDAYIAELESHLGEMQATVAHGMTREQSLRAQLAATQQQLREAVDVIDGLCRYADEYNVDARTYAALGKARAIRSRATVEREAKIEGK